MGRQSGKALQIVTRTKCGLGCEGMTSSNFVFCGFFVILWRRGTTNFGQANLLMSHRWMEQLESTLMFFSLRPAQKSNWWRRESKIPEFKPSLYLNIMTFCCGRPKKGGGSICWRNSGLSATCILVPVLLSLFCERRRKKEGRRAQQRNRLRGGVRGVYS